jgi:hypothetical protein
MKVAKISSPLGQVLMMAALMILMSLGTMAVVIVAGGF